MKEKRCIRGRIDDLIVVGARASLDIHDVSEIQSILSLALLNQFRIEPPLLDHLACHFESSGRQ